MRREPSDRMTMMLDANDSFGAVCIMVHCSDYLNDLFWDEMFSEDPSRNSSDKLAPLQTAIDLVNGAITGLLK